MRDSEEYLKGRSDCENGELAAAGTADYLRGYSEQYQREQSSELERGNSYYISCLLAHRHAN